MSSVSGLGGGLYVSNQRLVRRVRLQINATVDVAGAVDVINDLGLDTLTFLAVTIIVVPAFKIIKASPVRIKLVPQHFWTFFLHMFFYYI